ncbi:MAG: hypothetical protein HY787_02550 [Deltaproteobacteria bacterium]|nr:hypothetical protein [Deltaproteobacteria bacterium]
MRVRMNIFDVFLCNVWVDYIGGTCRLSQADLRFHQRLPSDQQVTTRQEIALSRHELIGLPDMNNLSLFIQQIGGFPANGSNKSKAPGKPPVLVGQAYRSKW